MTVAVAARFSLGTDEYRVPALRNLRAPLIAAIRSGDDGRVRDLVRAVGVEYSKIGVGVAAEEILAQARAIADAQAALDRLASAEGVQLLRGDSVKIESIDWAWRGWLALGKLHIIAGAPSTGKTTCAMALAATITRTGAKFPDGTTNVTARQVLIWSGEDDPGDTLAPRLKAMGADLGRVHFIGPVYHEGTSRPFDVSVDVPLLAVATERLKPALLIVDPVVLAVRGDSHKNGETRRGLQPLCDIASTLHCAVLGVSHYAKATAGRDPIERVAGSLAFGAVARIIFGTARQPSEKGGGGLIVRAKSNVGPDGGGFNYTIEPTTVQGQAGAVETSRILWGDPVHGSARVLLAAAEPQGEPANQESRDAGQWLAEVLGADSQDARTLRRLADDAGFAWRTVQRSAHSIGIQMTRTGFGPDCKTIWKLAADAQSRQRSPVAPTKKHGATGASGDADTIPEGVI